MDILRIQGGQGVPSLEEVGAHSHPESTPVIKRDVSDLQREIAPDFRFKPAMNTTPTVGLMEDALNDIQEAFRTNVIVTINQSVDKAKLQEQARLLLPQIKQFSSTPESVEEFRRIAKQYSKGSTAYELAMIEAMFHMDATGKTAHSGVTEEFIFYFLSRYEAELQAFLNIHKVLENHKEHIEVRELAGAYEEVLVKSQSIMQALGAIVKRIGVENLEAWRPFLVQSAIADLTSQHVGADKIQLMFILQELKGLQILNTFKTMLDEVEEKHLSEKKVKQFLQHSFDYIEQPIATIASIEKWLSACVTEEQILFFQDYRRVFHKISDEAYKSEEQKRNALTVLQKKIDEKVYNDEE